MNEGTLDLPGEGGVGRQERGSRNFGGRRR